MSLPVPNCPASVDFDLGELTELAARVAELPDPFRSRIEPILERLAARTEQRSRMLRVVHESMVQLRMDMTYLVFDLECTRRERDAFRQQIS